MSKFVNYKKRNVALPPGCKDLVDVLRSRRRPDSAGVMEVDNRPTVSRGGEVTGGLSEIEKYVRMVFASRGLGFTLTVTPPDKRFSVHVARMEDGTMWASVRVQEDTEPATAVRGFLTRHGFVLPKDSGTPVFFLPGVLVDVSYNISTTPPDATQLARLLGSLFREACGLADDC